VIVLDTNVVSEVIRPAPEARVLRWLDAQAPQALSITAVTVGEIVHGVARLPEGRRRDRLAALVEEHVTTTFAGRVLSYDADAARVGGTLLALRERAGWPMSLADAQIAAICRVHDATLATRNVRDFVGTRVAVVDPWKPAPS